MKKITIKNIGPLDHVVLDLNKVNIIMGPQSSGKSTIAKIISYCQWVEKRFILDGEYKYKFTDQFIGFHRDELNNMISEAIANKLKKNLSYEEKIIGEFVNLLKLSIAYQHTNFIIEEPEQNLFLATQRDLVYFILQKINNSSKDHSVLITTHSPYILYAFNNCMMGYNVQEEMPEEEQSELLSHQSWIDPKLVSVWEIENGTLKSIQDKNTGTVSKHYFNKIMNDVMDEYYEMLNYFRV